MIVKKTGKFLKENIVWLLILAAYLVGSTMYGVWYVNHPELHAETETEMAEDAVAVSAEPEDAVHTVTFNTLVGRIKGQDSIVKDHDSVLDYVPEVESSKYDFAGWYMDCTFTTPYVPGETVINADTDIWAKHDTPTAMKENLQAPVIYIDYDGKVDKDRYTKCTVLIEHDEMIYSWKELPAQIRGRGNSTWNYDKKPYRLKFDDKVDLFGMGKARDWVLLANTVDMTMLRNLAVYRMAQEFESMKYTTDCEFVHIYLNDDYRGLYLVVEQVEEGKNRVEIGDGLKSDGKVSSPKETGFLLECGNGDSSGGQKEFRPESSGRVSTEKVVIKSPEPEVLTDAHVSYIKKYYEDVQKAIAEDDFDTLCNLVDIDSVVDSFICTQYVLSGDMGYDYFVYKEPGGKLFMGPLWDYDQSSGSSEHGGKNHRGYSAADPHPWYVKLIENEKFRALVIEAWLEHYDYIHGIPDMLYGIAAQYQADIDLNYERWEGFLGSKQWRTPMDLVRLKTYPEHVDYLIKWLNNRVAWIENDLGIVREAE